MRLFATAIVLFLAACRCSLPASAAPWGDALAKRLQLSVQELTVGGRPAFILLPGSDTRSRGRQPWVLYAPALPDYPDEHERWMHQQLVAAGVAVAGIDVGECYGSPRGQTGISALYDELVKRRGFAPKPCLLGRSRGGLWVVSWAGRNPEKVSGVAGIYPAFDLRTYPGLDKAASAFELTPEQLAKDLEQYNPIEQAAALVKARVPAYLIHGAIDEVVPLKQNSAEFAARYEAAGVKELVILNAIADQGHNFWPGFFQDRKLVEFAVARAKEGAGNLEPSDAGAAK